MKNTCFYIDLLQTYSITKVLIKQVSEITGQGTLIWSPFCIYILLEMWLGNLVS